MVIAGFITFGNRGFWLPNDPRGSWSTQVKAPHLRRFGPATKTDARVSVAHRPHDRAARLEARGALKYPPVVWTTEQVSAIGVGFAGIIQTLGITVYACAVMPDHAHLVVQKHGRTFEELSGFLRRAAGRELTRRGLHPYEPYRDPATDRVPSPWAAGNGWVVFLDHPDDVRRKIRYVNGNPIKAGLAAQEWGFVTPYV